jgi:uncharacterized protein YaiL (DUF2058 family)
MNLRDQLQKANLLSKKDAKRLAHEQRVERTEIGRDGVERQQREHQEELERKLAEERTQRKVAQAQTEAERKVAEERAACEQILGQDVRRPGHGRQRFYFQTVDGALPWLEFGDIELKQMLSAEFAVVRVGAKNTHDYGLLPVATAKRVSRQFPDKIAWWPPGAGQV